MTYDEINSYIENISSNENSESDETKRIISILHDYIKTQNEEIVGFRNNYIRMENNLKLVENQISTYSAYKRLCDTILERINDNPFKALWFLYSVKRKIGEFNKNQNS